MDYNRRNALGLIAGLACLTPAMALGQSQDKFIRRKNMHFHYLGKPYRYLGTNMWYGAYLCRTPDGQARMRHELDHLASLGVTNIRILGLSEDSPLNNSMKPAMHNAEDIWREDILLGLDFMLAEMAKRNQKAVIFLNNFWEWSGGMMTYQSWVNGGHYIDLNDPKHPWPEFADASAQFYTNAKAVVQNRKSIEHIVCRKNSITGMPYSDDPTIMAWQLSNEPRPGGSSEKTNFAAFYSWIGETARYIKQLDPHHLVSTGNEGIMGCLQQSECVINASSSDAIDYITMHIWPLNWGWIDPKNFDATFSAGLAKTRAYIDDHVALARKLQKPLVAEEFGLPRDGGGYSPDIPTHYRDRYFEVVFDAVRMDATQNGPFAGTNFWAWGGRGRAQHADYKMQLSDTEYLGDPPQEPQGQNSVFDTDGSTLALIHTQSQALKNISDKQNL